MDTGRDVLRVLIDPASVAIYDPQPNAFGGRILDALHRHGYPGRVLPIPPKQLPALNPKSDRRGRRSLCERDDRAGL